MARGLRRAATGWRRTLPLLGVLRNSAVGSRIRPPQRRAGVMRKGVGSGRHSQAGYLARQLRREATNAICADHEIRACEGCLHHKT